MTTKRIKITTMQEVDILRQVNILKQRIERKHSGISHGDMTGILSKIENMFYNMLQDIFELKDTEIKVKENKQ